MRDALEVLAMDGAVTCRCYRTGHTRPHPHPRTLLEPVPGLFIVREDASDQEREAHEEWLATACPHPLMQLVSESVWTPAGRGPLAAALASLGGADRASAQTLIDLLALEEPPEPWGPERVGALAQALAWTRAHLSRVQVHQCVTLDSGVVLLEGAPERTYCYTGDGDRLGIDAGGLFVERRGKRLLHSKQIQQIEEADGRFTLVGDPGHASVRTSAAFEPDDVENPERPGHLPGTVLHRTIERSAAEFAELLDPLDRLIAAAIDTGHCILWFDEGGTGW